MSHEISLMNEAHHTDRRAEDHPPRLCFIGLDNLPVFAPEFAGRGVGGEQVQHALLARAFQRRGFDVSMIVYDWGQPDGATWDGIRTYKAYEPHAGIPMLRFFHPRWTAVWSAMTRARADVYYLSCADMRLGLAVMHAARHQPRSRIIFRIAHDTDCEPDRLLIRYRRDKVLYEYGLRRADVVLAQSQQQQQAMQRNYGVQPRLARMLVDVPTSIRSFHERDIPALWVNNIRDFKRPDLALRLAAGMRAGALHMIGGRQPGFDAMYERIAADAAAIGNLTFHGPVPYRDVNAFYERAVVFVNTSDSEGFPNSYLQAWARGTPVVAFFDPDGIIAREGLGFIVRDVDEMREVVHRLCAQPAEWQAVSRCCSAYMQRHYGEEAIMQAYLSAVLPAGARAGGSPAPSFA